MKLKQRTVVVTAILIALSLSGVAAFALTRHAIANDSARTSAHLSELMAGY